MQEEVIEILVKHSSKTKPMSRGQIAIELNVCPRIVSRAIVQLLKYSEIKFVEIDRNEAKKLYGAFRRMKVYYI
jgi:hypothetical protein